MEYVEQLPHTLIVYMIVKYYEDKVIECKKSIFLAGPTLRKEIVKSWRPQAIEILEELGFDGVVYVPEFKQYTEIPNNVSTIEILCG